MNGRVAKNPNLPVYFPQISLAIRFNFLVLSRLSCPISPDDIAGQDRMAISILDSSMARKLISGVQGRFSDGVRQPTDWLDLALSRNVEGKKW